MSKAVNDSQSRVSSKLGTYTGRTTQPQKAPEQPWLAHTTEDSSENLSQTTIFSSGPRSQVSVFFVSIRKDKVSKYKTWPRDRARTLCKAGHMT